MGAQNREAVESLADSIANDIKAGRWGDVLPVNAALIRELGSKALAALDVLQDRGVVVRGYVHGHATRRWVVTGTVPVFATAAEKVADAIEQKIENGQWRELPGHRSIAQEVHADPDAVTAALCELQARGVVTKSRGADGFYKWMLVGADGEPTERPPGGRARALISERIESGQWKVLPTAADMSTELGVSRKAIAHAVRSLVADGRVQYTFVDGRGRWLASGHVPAQHYGARALAEEIARRIETGTWTTLPTIAEMVAEFGYSPPAVLRALRMLDEKGVVEKFTGSGVPGGVRWVVAGQLPSRLVRQAGEADSVAAASDDVTV